MSKTLIIVYGKVRTLEACLNTLYAHVIFPHRPCHVVISIDGSYADIPQSVLKRLDHVLLDIYTTEHKSVERDAHRIEFTLVYEALRRITNKDDYTYCVKIRTDLYVKYPLCPLRVLFAECPRAMFTSAFDSFCSHLEPGTSHGKAIISWFTCAGMHHFLEVQKAPNSPWSLTTMDVWNKTLFETLESESDTDAYTIVRRYAREHSLVFLIGSTWIHYGRMSHIDDLSQSIYTTYGTLAWPGVRDTDVLSWTDHKGRVHQRTHAQWKWITDNQLRLLHHSHSSYTLFDLVNPQDYIESFDATHTHDVNIKNSSLLIWIVRPHQIILKPS
jgi:hypothetical protein